MLIAIDNDSSENIQSVLVINDETGVGKIIFLIL